MARRMSRAEADVAARMVAAEPGSDRHHVLQAAASFRASWVGLGERLTWVRESQAFASWGYESFDAYCRRELKIKSETANKLTRSFSFLRDHEPKALTNEASSRSLPPLDVVDLLSQARERTELSEDALREISKDVLSSEQAPTRQEVLKQLRAADPEAFKPAPKEPAIGAAPDAVELRKALLLAERLAGLLEAQDPELFGKAAREVAGVARSLSRHVTRAPGTSVAAHEATGSVAIN